MLDFCKVANGDEEEEQEENGPPVPKEQVTEFLAENPNPSDAEVHEWTEEQGKGVHATEENIYELATEAAQFHEGGAANEKGLTAAEAPPEELAEGTEVELEHTPNPATAQRIAPDHIAESEGYYPALEEMEETLEDKKEAHLKRAYWFGVDRAARELDIPFEAAAKIAAFGASAQ